MKVQGSENPPEESYSQLGANLIKYFDKWLQQEGVETVQNIKNILGLEQFYSLLLGDLRYLVRDKKPKDIQEAGEVADFISHIRNPNFSEVKVGRKTSDDSKKDPKGYLRNQQASGGLR